MTSTKFVVQPCTFKRGFNKWQFFPPTEQENYKKIVMLAIDDVEIKDFEVIRNIAKRNRTDPSDLADDDYSNR